MDLEKILAELKEVVLDNVHEEPEKFGYIIAEYIGKQLDAIVTYENISKFNKTGFNDENLPIQIKTYFSSPEFIEKFQKMIDKHEIVTENIEDNCLILLPLVYDNKIKSIMTLKGAAGISENGHKPFYENLRKIIEKGLIKSIEFNEEKIKGIYDPLTRVYQKRHLYDAIDNELQNARVFNQPTSIILLDIDNFKFVNDSYGHLVGDEVLKKYVNLIVEHIKQNAPKNKYVVGRYGGEEFVVLSKNSSEKSARDFAELLRYIIEQNPLIYNGKEIPISASFGVAESNPKIKNISESREDLLERADKAMYYAKNTGKNKVCSYSEYINRTPFSKIAYNLKRYIKNQIKRLVR